jgi:hypothetical protein
MIVGNNKRTPRRQRYVNLLQELIAEHGDLRYSEGLALLSHRRPAGAPPTWDDFLKHFIFLRVEALIEKGVNPRRACRAFAEHFGPSLGVVEKRYVEGRALFGRYDKARANQIRSEHEESLTKFLRDVSIPAASKRTAITNAF